MGLVERVKDALGEAGLYMAALVGIAVLVVVLGFGIRFFDSGGDSDGCARFAAMTPAEYQAWVDRAMDRGASDDYQFANECRDGAAAYPDADPGAVP